MRALEELQRLGIERCPECKCAVGDDWDYKDFTNKTTVVCPQCGEEIYLNSWLRSGTYVFTRGGKWGAEKHIIEARTEDKAKEELKKLVADPENFNLMTKKVPIRTKSQILKKKVSRESL